MTPERPVLLGRAQIEKDVDIENNEAKETIQKGGRRQLPVVAWFQMLYRAFGLFVPLALLSYGIQQSFGKTYQTFACKYYMMNDLELDGVTMGRLMAAASVPWNIKPLLGMLSDTFPLGGYHRTSYLVLACSFSILLHSWIGLSAVSSLGLVAFMTCVNFTTAFSDVLVDATSAILSKDHPSEACDLQVALRISESAGGIMAGAVKGSVVAHFGARYAILGNAFSALTVLFPALRGWLPEERLKGKLGDEFLSVDLQLQTGDVSDRNGKSSCATFILNLRGFNSFPKIYGRGIQSRYHFGIEKCGA